MFVQCGSCPKCGAPIYHPEMWQSILPPVAVHTCNCNPGPRVIVSDNTANAVVNWPK